MTIEVLLNGFLGLAVFFSQLLKCLLTKDIFLKKFLAPFGSLVLFYKLAAAILTLKQLLAITGFTIFNNMVETALTALFLGIKLE